MANKHDSLNELFAATANAIRSKTGSSAKIVADDFPSAISDIVMGIDTTIDQAVAATSDDMREGVEAYVNGTKVVGTLPLWKSIAWNTPTATFEDGKLCLKGNVDVRRMLEKSSPATMWCAGDKLGNAGAEDVAKGKYFTSKDGLLVEGTHECSLPTLSSPATKTDIAEGLEAWVNGEKVTGTVKTYAKQAGWTVSPEEEAGRVSLKIDTNTPYLFRKGVIMNTALSNFGNASADQVEEGMTFTSADGLLVEGTMKVNGAHCWKRYSVRRNYDVIVENLGTTRPSDMGYTSGGSYTITNDKYFKLNSGTAVFTKYYLPTGQQDGQAIYIYKESKPVMSGSSTTYSKLTIGDSYSDDKGDFLKYISSDIGATYPINGIGDDGYWYEYIVTDDITDTTFKRGTFKIGEDDGDGLSSMFLSNYTFDIGLSNVSSITVTRNGTDVLNGCQFYWMYDGSKSFVGKIDSSGEKVFEECNCIEFSNGTCTIGSIGDFTSIVITDGTYSWIASGTV